MTARTLSFLTAALLIIGLIFWNHSRSTPRPPPPVADNSGTTAPKRLAQPSLPAPPSLATSSPVETNTNNPTLTNLLALLLKGETNAILTLAQVEGYLHDNHRNVESLLAAFHVTQDESLLAEAKEKFPNDPRVDFAAATRSGDSPEEHRQWLDAFKKSAPDSALPDLLSASDYFKSGRTDLALQEVQVAANKPIQDYQLDFLQNAQEAYRAAGYSEAEAKMIASMNLLVPEVSAYKSIGVGLVDLATSYQQAGDSASAQVSLQMAMDLGQRVNDSDSLTLIQTLVGIAVEKKALGAMDPTAVYGSNNQTVQSQLDALTQQRDSIRTLFKQWQAIAPYMSDQDLANYVDRHWRFGEHAAMQWAVDKYGQPTGN